MHSSLVNPPGPPLRRRTSLLIAAILATAAGVLPLVPRVRHVPGFGELLVVLLAFSGVLIALDVNCRHRMEQALRKALAETEEARQLLDAVFTAQTDGLIVCDPDGRIVRTNPAAAAFFGFDPAGMRLPQMLDHFHLAGGIASSVTERALHGQTTVNQEQTTGDRFIETSSAPMRDQNGRILGAVTISRDVTERKRSEELLRQAQKWESIGLLAGGIAHDFNNILTAVSGNVALALDDLGPECEPARRALRLAEDAAQRAARLTRQLLAYAGKGGFVREAISASAVAQSTLQFLRPSLPKQIEIRAELAPDLPLVEMDPSQMEQILVNLILNGAEAIGEHQSGMLTVRTGSGGRFVSVEVADTGCGMDEPTRKRIFEPFFTTKFAGRGLGLSAVQGIVRALDGEISVESSVGCGTRIQVLLPAYAATGAAGSRRCRVA